MLWSQNLCNLLEQLTRLRSEYTYHLADNSCIRCWSSQRTDHSRRNDRPMPPGFSSSNSTQERHMANGRDVGDGRSCDRPFRIFRDAVLDLCQPPSPGQFYPPPRGLQARYAGVVTGQALQETQLHCAGLYGQVAATNKLCAFMP